MAGLEILLPGIGVTLARFASSDGGSTFCSVRTCFSDPVEATLLFGPEITLDDQWLEAVSDTGSKTAG